MTKTIFSLIGLTVVLSALQGCAPTAFTNIESIGDGKFRVTEVKAGFFRVKGILYECQGSGATLKCVEIGTK